MDAKTTPRITHEFINGSTPESAVGAPLPRLIIRALHEAIETYKGPAQGLRRHRSSLQALPTIEQGIQNFERRLTTKLQEPTDGPVFILSSGWRTGSTLVQRLVMSSNKILVWGEPYAHCGHIRRLASALQAFTPEFPAERDLLRAHRASGLDSSRWIANLYPDPEHLLQAHRRFFQSLFAEPSLSANYAYWGVKAVRLELAHAHYLKWLFPRARFLFVFRNPFDAYRSYRRFRKQVWYDRWPEAPVITPAAFGSHWHKLLAGFLAGYQRVGGRLIKYEDLCSGRLNIEDLAQYLQLDLKPQILSVRIVSGRSPSNRAVRQSALTSAELRLLRKAVEPLASQLGYAERTP